MYAALYAESEVVRALLDRGADPKVANHAGATALMWAVADAAKTKLLLDHPRKGPSNACTAIVVQRTADGKVQGSS